MARKGIGRRKNVIPAVRLELSIDPTTDKILRQMLTLGIHGRSKAEVANWVLSQWIYMNQGYLKESGIRLARTRAG